MTKLINMKEKQIREFFNQDIVDLKHCPDEKVRERFPRKRQIDFSSIPSEKARQQYKDLLVNCICYEKPYCISSRMFSPAINLIDFFKTLDDFLEIPDTELKEKFLNFSMEKNYGKDRSKMIISCKEALIEMYDTRTGFDRDLWDSKILSLAEERLNKTSSANKSLHFRKITNKSNRELTKMFIRHLLGNTEMAYGTIYHAFYLMVIFCEFFKDKNLLELTKEDIERYIDSRKELQSSAFNKSILTVYKFYEYMRIKEKFNADNPVSINMYKKRKDKKIYSSVSEYVILQIFQNLHTAPFYLQLMWLINYCTGMRSSDVCQLRTDCLFEDGKNGYYIKPYTCQKMQKPIMNLIPKALFELIQEQIKIINQLDYDEIYLFPSPEMKNMPFQTQTFRRAFKRLCKKWEIKNDDGTPYIYRSHSYRHTIATDLHQNYDVPIVTIQKAVLWHDEIQMSLHYIERPEEFVRLEEDKYISKCGEVELTTYMKETLKDHVMANGVCGRASKLGICPHMDACLSCEHFLTSKRFLPVHRKQLLAIKAKMPIFEANGWTDNIETAKKQIQQLEAIIQKLEEKEDSDACITINQ